jgi:UDP-N-acetylmuramoylalanine--D-glutamate ligase
MKNESKSSSNGKTAHNLRGKKVTVMGLGLHGGALGTIDWLAKQGAVITVTDIKTAEQLAGSVAKLETYTGITLVLGQHREEDFIETSLVIRNPSVPRHSKYLEIARAHGIPVEMDSSLFFQHSPSRNIIGITGSKGKTTTSNALAVLFKAFWPQTVAVGIDGVSPLKELAAVKAGSPIIFELSSWRLEALDERHMSPHIAVVTSIYRDHLNTYASFEEYIEMKKTIIRYQTADDICLLNYDDAVIKTWKSETGAKQYWYSITDLPEDQDGIFITDDTITIRQDGHTTELFSATLLPLHSPHEQRNLLPAIFLSFLHGIAAEKIARALPLIRGLPHRLEKVRELDGVTYINDSAATMPDATIAALTALSGQKLVAIIGGSDKNLIFDDLAYAISQANISALIYLPGTATQRMKQTITEKNPNIPTQDAASMDEAVQLARQTAKTGDAVLLSPGATSFGLFLHEFDRGNKFREAVLNLN